MNVLAFDLATKMGWAAGRVTPDGGLTITHSGSQAFPIRSLIGPGRRGLQVLRWMRQLIASHRPQAVFYEKVGGAPAKNGIQAIHLYGLYQGLLQMACSEADLVPRPLHIGTIKKHATGHGDASKAAMMAAAAQRWPGLKIIDDNHADALWILALGTTAKPEQLPLIRT